MALKPRVTFVLGTRPEVIKLAVVIMRFKESQDIETRVVLSGQHRDMANQVMNLFEIKENRNIDLMSHGQNLSHITSSVLNGLKIEFKEFPPKLVFVQGDTATAFSASLAAFYEQIPVAHVEAGLRTNNWLEPFPEEMYRRLISQIAHLHFAPTYCSALNLNSAGVLGNILVTGNTVIDAIDYISSKLPRLALKGIDWTVQKVILITVHRRENRGERLGQIASGIRKILESNNDVVLLFPLHPDPELGKRIRKLLGNHSRIIFTEPLEYNFFLAAIRDCSLILTDSGSIQEEACAFAKPVLVLRETTERNEAVKIGIATLVGTNPVTICSETTRVLKDLECFNTKVKRIPNPFGDGKSSKRIFNASRTFLEL